jgi:lysine 2,3-aminomutase
MTTSAATTKGETLGQAEEEPPGATLIASEAEEEPPSKTGLSNRSRFFGHVPEERWKDWRWHFRSRLTNIDELARFIPLSAQEQTQLRLVTAKYPLSITPYYLCLIDPSDPGDPIRRQAIPAFEEIALAEMGVEDPLGEAEDSPVPGLVHRYPDRVLMVLTNLCPMLCRHCTRKREWQHGVWVRTTGEIEAMLDYIRNNKIIRDVIISGGDPLTLSTSRLEDVISRLRQIEHVEIIRIGTRFPVVLPQRIDDELCVMLSRYGPIWLNTQFNHPHEITPESAAACDRLLRSGVPVSNQSVLLRGVNDSVETQIKLCHKLLKIKVRPYYLFQCDEVQGTEHLRTPVEAGIEIIEGMRGHTSGLAVPTFVVDLPQGGGKVSLQPNYMVSQTEKGLVLRNYQGRLFHYRNPEGSSHPGIGRGNGKPRATQGALAESQSQLTGVKDEDRALVRS